MDHDSASIPARQPHAALGLSGRRLKGLKIERLLSLKATSCPLRILEVGTGSGGIAHFFGTHSTLDCEVDSLDVVDSRLVHDGYRFHQVDDVKIPFEDDTFDVVLSNHVIEHVGDDDAQAEHLAELKRVMKPDGLGYLAVPNRWMLVEPHYKLAFLSWWPERWRTTYLRLMRRGQYYDCRPYSAAGLDRDFTNAGFNFRNASVEALYATLEIEEGHAFARMLIAVLPNHVLRRLERCSPTLIYLFWVSEAPGSEYKVYCS